MECGRAERELGLEEGDQGLNPSSAMQLLRWLALEKPSRLVGLPYSTGLLGMDILPPLPYMNMEPLVGVDGWWMWGSPFFTQLVTDS